MPMSGPGEKKLKERRMKRTEKKDREQARKQRQPRETPAIQLKGRWWAEVEDDQGNVTRTPTTSYIPNLIVSNAKILMAALFKNDPAFPGGILYHAVGEGDSAWDTAGTPGPSFAQTTLVSEEFRKTPTQIVYIDGVGDPTATPTNIIRVKTVFEQTDLIPTGVDLREHGLFGGDATAAADSGLMIDAINMSSIWKDNTVTLTLYIELEF
jgi:hypothetical protein